MTELDIIVNVINTLSKNAKCRERYFSELENFRNREIQTRSNRYRLGVIGVTSSGKSTMINSLLGESLLPAAARPSSSQLVSCFKSNSRSAKVYFQNGETKTYTGSQLSKVLIGKYGDEGVNSKNKEAVKQIEISSPSFPFGEEIVLVDSPGLDAYGYEGHEQLTMNSLLPTIDFCIFVTTCKTNSDEKMKSVLNTIAEYEKPVIIVQNMIDSLRPSLDGKKTVADVAQDHRVRVERIISQSNIRDKSKVHIVQISAINALKARENNLRNKEDIRLLEDSNYVKLIEVVHTAFNQVQPLVEGHRMTILKKEIDRIAQAALSDGAGFTTIPNFEYDGVKNQYDSRRRTCEISLMKNLDRLRSQIPIINQKNSFNEYDITDIKAASMNCENEICSQMNILNNSIIEICRKLNVDSRNILTDFRFDKPDLYLKKNQEVVKSGYWKEKKLNLVQKGINKVASWFGKEVYEAKVYVDTTHTIEVTDIASTRENFINYINQSLFIFQKTIENWERSITITENKLFSEIENRRSEYKARKDRALDCQVYRQIGTELRNIANSISYIPNQTSIINSTKTDVKETCTFTVEDKCGLVPLLKLSEHIRLKIHNAICDAFINKKNETHIIGWDENCEEKFLKYAFGFENMQSIHKHHKPAEIKLSGIGVNKNIVILVNATQMGSARKELAAVRIENITRYDTVYFVIQDFNEIMNGNSVDETLDNILELKNFKGINGNPCRVLLLHDNPIYNMVAVETQAIHCTTTQNDEVRIINDLQGKFPYLLPNDKTTKNNALSTIRTIIQKLGKI